jgi:hypothetical protein
MNNKAVALLAAKKKTAPEIRGSPGPNLVYQANGDPPTSKASHTGVVASAYLNKVGTSIA